VRLFDFILIIVSINHDPKRNFHPNGVEWYSGFVGTCKSQTGQNTAAL
jgi:hypothetical protein